MRNYYLLPVIALVGLSGCSHLRPKYCTETRAIAEQAMDRANQAFEEAKQASKSAEKSAARADRIFKESQKK